jgi:cell division protein FtsN
MPKDYKKPARPENRRGSMLLGIMIGLVLGLAIALGVAWYINRMPSPFTAKPPIPAPRAETSKQGTATKPAEPSTQKSAEKPRFDFYKILPGSEEPATDQQLKDAKKSAEAGKETFYLQAGAFQSAPDADNLKARLALLGIEASIQTTTLPDKSVWHRVRLGPYTNVEEVNQARAMLKQNGVDSTLIKVRLAGK